MNKINTQYEFYIIRMFSGLYFIYGEDYGTEDPFFATHYSSLSLAKRAAIQDGDTIVQMKVFMKDMEKE